MDYHIAGIKWIRRLTGLLLLCSNLFYPLPVLADIKDDVLTEDDYLGKVPVVLSATRLLQPRSDAPASITIIDRKMIEASGAQEIPDILRLVPGIQVGHTRDQRTIVTYHGFSDNFARRMQVLVDGRSVYSPMFGGINWPDLALAIEDIERIEVIRGPNSAAYGANAFLAIINIITRHPNSVKGHQIVTTGGDIATRKVFHRYGGSSGKLNYRISTGVRIDSGTEIARDDKRVGLFTMRGEYLIDPKNTFDFQFGFNDGARETGNNKVLDPNRDVETQSNFQQLLWRHTVSNDEEVTLQFYRNYYRIEDKYGIGLLSTLLGITPAQVPIALAANGLPALPDHALVFSESYTTERFNLEFVHRLKPADNLRLVWGAESRLDRARAKGWFGTNKYRRNRTNRLFSNAEWRFHPKWVMNLGAMLEDNTHTGSDVSPRLALNFKVDSENTVRFAVTRAFRTPALLEERANIAIRLSDGTAIRQLIFSDGNLKPEQITSTELGYIGDFPRQNVRIDFKVFEDRIKDVIVITKDNAFPGPIGPQSATVFFNNGSAKIRGAELELKYSPTRKTRLVFSSSYGRNRGNAIKGINPIVTVQTKQSTPTLTQSIMIMHEFPKRFHASFAYYKVSNMEFFGSGDETGGYDTKDWRIAKRFGKNKTKGEIALIVKNSGGTYFDYAAEIVQKKRYFITLKLDF